MTYFSAIVASCVLDTLGTSHSWSNLASAISFFWALSWSSSRWSSHSLFFSPNSLSLTSLRNLSSRRFNSCSRWDGGIEQHSTCNMHYSSHFPSTNQRADTSTKQLTSMSSFSFCLSVAWGPPSCKVECWCCSWEITSLSCCSSCLNSAICSVNLQQSCNHNNLPYVHKGISPCRYTGFCTQTT